MLTRPMAIRGRLRATGSQSQCNIPMCGRSPSSPGQSFYARTFSSAFHLASGTPPTIPASSSLPKSPTTHGGWYDSLVKPKTHTLGGGGGEGGGRIWTLYPPVTHPSAPNGNTQALPTLLISRFHATSLGQTEFVLRLPQGIQ